MVSFITTQPWPMFHLCGTSFFIYYSIRVNDRVEQLAVSVYVSFVAMLFAKTKPTCITSDKYRKNYLYTIINDIFLTKLPLISNYWTPHVLNHGMEVQVCGEQLIPTTNIKSHGSGIGNSTTD